MVICLERGADLHMAHLMPLPLTVSCFSKILIGFTFLVPPHPGSPGLTCVCVCVCPVPTAQSCGAGSCAIADTCENILKMVNDEYCTQCRFCCRTEFHVYFSSIKESHLFVLTFFGLFAIDHV